VGYLNCALASSRAAGINDMNIPNNINNNVDDMDVVNRR